LSVCAVPEVVSGVGSALALLDVPDGAGLEAAAAGVVFLATLSDEAGELPDAPHGAELEAAVAVFPVEAAAVAVFPVLLSVEVGELLVAVFDHETEFEGAAGGVCPALLLVEVSELLVAVFGHGAEETVRAGRTFAPDRSKRSSRISREMETGPRRIRF
jgi:hypothetical protein